MTRFNSSSSKSETFQRIWIKFWRLVNFLCTKSDSSEFPNSWSEAVWNYYFKNWHVVKLFFKIWSVVDLLNFYPAFRRSTKNAKFVVSMVQRNSKRDLLNANFYSNSDPFQVSCYNFWNVGKVSVQILTHCKILNKKSDSLW